MAELAFNAVKQIFLTLPYLIITYSQMTQFDLTNDNKLVGHTLTGI